MNLDAVRAHIQEAMFAIEHLACESPPDNGMSYEDLVADTEGTDPLDNGSAVGQMAWLHLRDALKQLEG